VHYIWTKLAQALPVQYKVPHQSQYIPAGPKFKYFRCVPTRGGSGRLAARENHCRWTVRCRYDRKNPHKCFNGTGHWSDFRSD
jgi:hypothetical protein